jgi:hypothetical protein
VVECKCEMERKRSHECERGTQECVRHKHERGRAHYKHRRVRHAAP